MKKNRILHRCFACFGGYPCGRVHIPRRHKKQVIALLKLLGSNLVAWEWATEICQLHTAYKELKPAIRKYAYLKSYAPQIKFLIQYSDQFDSQPLKIDRKGNFVWGWESDGDYGGSSGYMEIAYSKEAAGKTWAFDQIDHQFWAMYGINMPAEIKCDRDLLYYIKVNPPCGDIENDYTKIA